MIPFKRMPPSWKDICTSFQQSLPVSRSPQTREIVESWHQLVRYVALQLSSTVNRSVTLNLTKAQKTGRESLVDDDLFNLVENGKLKAEFTIPDAAARIRFKADLKRRILSASMKIDAPGDRIQAKSSINWFFKQIEKCGDDNISVIAFWPGKTPQTHATLGKLKEDRRVLLSEFTSSAPEAFIVRRVVDLAGKFSGVSILVEEAEKLLPNFYKDIGQFLQTWKPSPPKVVASVEDVHEGISDDPKKEGPTTMYPPMVIPEPMATEQAEKALSNVQGAESDRKLGMP